MYCIFFEVLYLLDQVFQITYNSSVETDAKESLRHETKPHKDNDTNWLIFSKSQAILIAFLFNL